MAIQLPPGAVDITNVDVIILDSTGRCNAPDASGGNEILRDTLVIGVPKQLTVSSGQRTISLVALNGSTPVARGCDQLELLPGETHMVNISLVEYPDMGDGGMGDASMPDADVNAPDADVNAPDAGPADATQADADPNAPDALPPPLNDVCAGSDGLVLNDPAESHTTTSANDDYDLSCLPTESGDVVHDFTLGADQATLVTVTASGWDAALELRQKTNCETGPEISCVADGSGSRRINQPNLAMGDYSVIVDGAAGQSGDYTISVETRAADMTFGYWAIDTTGTYASIAGTSGATMQTIPQSPTGTLDPGDEWSLAVAFPFTFDFFGTSYNVVNVMSNMFLAFGAAPSGDDSYNHDCPLAGSDTPENIIAVFWGDGISTQDSDTQLWTKTEGSMPNRRFIIEFKDWDMLYCAPVCTFLDVKANQQIIVHENGDIELRYGPRQQSSQSKGCGTQHTGCASTIGIEGQVMAVTDADDIQCDMDGVTDGRVIYYVHPR